MVHQLVYNNTAATVVPASQSPPQEEYLSAYALARSRSSHIRSRSVSSVASDCIRSVSSRSSSASRTPSAASVTTDASGTLHPRDYHRIRAQQKLALSSTSSNGGDSTDKLQQRSNSVTRRNTITTTVETSATVAVSAHAYASEECSSIRRDRSRSASSSSSWLTPPPLSRSPSTASSSRSSQHTKKSVRFVEDFSDCAMPEAPMPPAIMELESPTMVSVEEWVMQQQQEVLGAMKKGTKGWAYDHDGTIVMASGQALERGRKCEKW